MQKGEQTTNNGSCLGDSAQIFPYTPYFFAKASLMEIHVQHAAWGTVRDFYPLIRKLAKLSVMENQEDGDPCNGTPGLGKPYEYGDGHGSCAQ